MHLTLLILFLHSTSITIIAVHPSVPDILANSSFSDIEHDNTEYLQHIFCLQQARNGKAVVAAPPSKAAIHPA